MSNGGSVDPMIGLDLGTTNSCASFVNAIGEVGRVAAATGNNPPYDRVLATVVLDPQGEAPLIGLEAEQARETRPDDKYMAYFKHLLDSQRLQQLRLKAVTIRTGEYDFVAQGDRYKTVTDWVEVGGDHSREQVVSAAALILERLLQRALAAGADPDSVVLVGVPVSFSGYARKRLVCALERVRREDGSRLFDGFGDVIERVRFVLEPVAVAAAPGEDLEINDSDYVLIFDHGGGTLDLSLIRYERRAGFGRPVPVRELAAGGSGNVAGRHMDMAFMETLTADPAMAAALEGRMPEVVARRQAVERCKRQLSTANRARIPIADVTVERATFEAAIEPLLVLTEAEVLDTLKRGEISTEDLGWVVMTGGSSLVPAVQERMTRLFPSLAERDRILRYDPADHGGVESAITDVAEGLALFGQQDSFQQVVLWDLELGREESGDFVPLIRRGTPFETRGGRHELTTVIDLAEESAGGCFGLYENQLDRHFIFGLAEVPPLLPGSKLAVKLCRDGLFPTLGVIAPDGHLVTRQSSPSGWESDRYVGADIGSLDADQLEDFFYEDAEYVPAIRPEAFAHAPLVRRLRQGDYVEWSRRKIGSELRESHGIGRIERIRAIGDSGSLVEMTSWDVADFEFTLQTQLGTLKVESCNGSLRLAPNPKFEARS